MDEERDKLEAANWNNNPNAEITSIRVHLMFEYLSTGYILRQVTDEFHYSFVMVKLSEKICLLV